MQAANHQRRQDSLIHLADTSSRGVADRRTRSLSSQLPSDGHGSSAKANHLRVGHSSSTNKTRMYGNSLASATSAEDQGTRHRSVRLGHSRMAEVTSLMESLLNLITVWDQAHIIRETNERVIREE